jgi:hypothetical protein
MPITEESRFELYEKLRKALGAEEATTLMEHLPPVGWADVATKRDLERLATKDDLHALSNRMIGWMLASQATLVVAMALLVGLR